MELIQEIIFEQNKVLLMRIAKDLLETEKQREEFIKMFHKKNYAYIHICKSNKIKQYQKKIERIMR